jgi:hypothetical protein
MQSPARHVPFDSIYRPDFEVVEERRGHVSLFPHTAQLPLLIRALNLEFYGGLPDKIARVDKRADGYYKYLIRSAACLFCTIFNAGRKDGLHLISLPDADLVTRLVLVQQITEEHPLGRFHRFRFYGRDGFFPDVHLSGKRLAFADHVLQRFSRRVPNRIGEDLTFFLLTVYGSVYISLPLGQGRAFVLSYYNSVVAFTYTETPEEFFVTTCLTVNEMNALRPEMPPQALNLHYGREFVPPRIRNWLPLAVMLEVYKCWQKKTSLPPPVDTTTRFKNWKHMASYVKESALRSGHGPGTRLCFIDNIPGPETLELLPGQPEPVFDEVAAYDKVNPQYDWAAAFAESAARTSETPEEYLKRTRRHSL